VRQDTRGMRVARVLKTFLKIILHTLLLHSNLRELGKHLEGRDWALKERKKNGGKGQGGTERCSARHGQLYAQTRVNTPSELTENVLFLALSTIMTTPPAESSCVRITKDRLLVYDETMDTCDALLY
jgi:hypothetical protein